MRNYKASLTKENVLATATDEYHTKGTHLIGQHRRSIVDIVAHQPSDALGLIIAKLVSTLTKLFLNKLALELCNFLVPLLLRPSGVLSKDLIEAAFLFLLHLPSRVEFRLRRLN